MAVSAVEIQKDDQYVLNHRTRFLARDDDAPRHDFGQYEPGDPRNGVPPVGAGVDAGATLAVAPRTVLVAAGPR